MPFVTNCPGCQSQFELQDQLAGQQVQCQSCNTVFVAQQTTPTASAAPAASTGSIASVFDQVAGSSQAPSYGQQASHGQSVFGQSTGYESSYGHGPENPAPRQPIQHTGGNGAFVFCLVATVVFLIAGVGASVWYFMSGDKNPEVVANAPKDLSDLQKTMDQTQKDFAKQQQNAIRDMQKSMQGMDKIKIITTGIPPNKMNQFRSLGTEFKSKVSVKPSKFTSMESMTGTKNELQVGPYKHVDDVLSGITWGTIVEKDSKAGIVRVNADPNFVASDSSTSGRTGNQIAGNNPGIDSGRSDIEDQIAKQREQVEKEQKKIEAEMAQREKENQLERQKRANERAMASSNRDADRNGQPRGGETTAEWIKRNFDEPSPFYMSKFLKNLANMEPDEELREEVSTYLIDYHRENQRSNFGDTLKAMTAWKTDAIENEIYSMVGNSSYRLSGDELMAALERLGTNEAAEKLAVALPDFFSGQGSVKHLIAMGEKAEDAVIPYLKHGEEKVRERVYQILEKIGTAKSIDPLKQNKRLERDQRLKDMVQWTIDKVTERHPESEGDDG